MGFQVYRRLHPLVASCLTNHSALPASGQPSLSPSFWVTTGDPTLEGTGIPSTTVLGTPTPTTIPFVSPFVNQHHTSPRSKVERLESKKCHVANETS